MSKSNDRIKELSEEIHRHNIAYWKDHNPTISDIAFDVLMEELRGLAPFHPALTELIEDTNGKKIQHSNKMLSLEKVFGVADVVKWANECGAFKKSFNEGGGVCASFKVDGASCSLLYRDGKLVRAATRGNGKEGDDITANVLTIKGLPTTLTPTKFEDLQGEVEVRGEIYMSNASFADAVKAFEVLLAQGKTTEDKRPPNPRNYCAGSLKQKDAEVTRQRNLSFMAHNSVGLSGTEQQNYWTMHKWGFETPYFKVIGKSEDVASIVAEIDTARHKLPYATDGIVFGVNETGLHDELGCTGHHPKFRLAFKFARENAITKLEDIKWQTSRQGKLCPVLVLKPVFVGGATVTNCTIHNAMAVRNANLSIGDTVKIEREVIPYFLGREGAINAKNLIPLPNHCPSCQHLVEWDETETHLVCPNVGSCPAQLIEYICHYVSKKVTNMLGVGEEVIAELIAKGLVKSPADLYKLTTAQIIANLDRKGESSAKNIIDAIQSRRVQDLATFLVSLGIDHLGNTLSEKLAQRFETLNAVLALKASDFMDMSGIGDTLKRAIPDGLAERNGLIADLLQFVEVKDVVKASGPLLGKSFCCSGKVEFTYKGTLYANRLEIETLIKSMGGEAKSSVGSKITALIYGDGSGTKLEDAKKKGVTAMMGKDFETYLSALK